MKIALIAFHFSPDEIIGAVRADDWAKWISEDFGLVVITREMSLSGVEHAGGYRVVRPASFLTRLVERFKTRRRHLRVYIAPNVGIITSNHTVDDLDSHDKGQDVVIGEKCWIGMNAVVLPGVVLGPRTIVAAGSVVTKSFPAGDVVIGGVPAKMLKSVVRSEATNHGSESQ